MFELTVPVDCSEFDSGFNVRHKLLGERTCNIFHIQDTTGVEVNLMGQQKDGTLEFILACGDQHKLDDAASNCEDLIQTVHADYMEWLEERNGKKDNSKG
jgi:hypothetical protein